MKLSYFLLVFQLEGYNIGRFLKWLFTHKFCFAKSTEKVPVWTKKAKLLYLMSLVIFFLGVLTSFASLPIWASLSLGALVWTNSYLLLIGALLLLKPYEILNRWRVKYRIRRKIAAQRNLTVIGITGSYGKTSTKMVLSQLLTETLITPKSYNTMFGIYKVVDYELNSRYRRFICEMGAYKQGDIREFCQLTRPHIGVLTGINETHLERFGSIDTTIDTKFELLENLRADGVGVVNLDNQHIRENLEQLSTPARLIGYTVEGFESPACEKIASVTKWAIRDGRMQFRLSYKEEEFDFDTPLLGKAHLLNTLASIVVAFELGEKVDNIINRVAQLEQVSRRMEFKYESGLNILDNTFSSNPDSFRESLGILKSFRGRKILITPGMVELGEKRDAIHREIGSLAASICSEIVLVGESERTRSLQNGIIEAGFNRAHLLKVKRSEDVEELLRNTSRAGDTILLENVTDLPEHYH